MAENQIYGIDLGTSYSYIAYVDEHDKPVVVSNVDNDLTTILPDGVANPVRQNS